MPDVELVHILRGGLIDCVHRGRAAVLDTAGRLVFAAGDADTEVYLRSCAKPFQALAVIRSGAVEKYGFTPEELAVMAGSHSGTAEHTRLVAGILHKIGSDAGELQCGTDAPLSRAAYEQLLLNGEKPSALQHNCSGKHAGMLAACKAQGWDTATYLAAGHPLQQMILEIIAGFASMNPAKVVIALDGCGVPTFGLPLSRIALMFARLAAAAQDASSDPGVITRAMQQHPLLFSGENRADASLVLATAGRLVAKDGAEGLLGISVPDHGVGIAMKISDGSQRALIPAASRLLRDLNYIAADEAATLERLMPSIVRNNHGQPAGEMRAVLTIPAQ
jgi:L-asparaginase II